MPTEILMMKDSKIDWLGDIPQEWNIKKIKYCAYLKTGTTPDGNDGIVDEDADYNWYTPGDFVENYTLQLSERNILESAVKKYHIKLYSPDSVLMVCIGATVGKIGYINKYSYSNQQITALMPKKNVIGKFLLYLLSAMTKYMNENAQYTTLPIINNAYLSSINIALPNRLQEQQAIADFLDKKCKKIDKVIGEIEEQIQVLEDYKKSLITETVTKGLDKNVPMKDSGIDWIGKIPKNWDISKIKYEYDIQTGGTPDTSISEYYDGENKWVTIADINKKVIYDTESKITESAIKSCSIGISPKDSLLFSFKLSIGKVAFCGENLYTNEAIATFLKGVQPLQYLYYAAPIFIVKNANENIYGAKLLNQQLIKDAPIVLPPAEEQTEIADCLDKECEKIDKTINDKKEQLETIKEYKKSLIYEYITGKKRVAC